MGLFSQKESKRLVGKIIEYKALTFAAHSQTKGITQNIRLFCEVFEVLSH